MFSCGNEKTPLARSNNQSDGIVMLGPGLQSMIQLSYGTLLNKLSMNDFMVTISFFLMCGFISLSSSCELELMNRFNAASINITSITMFTIGVYTINDLMQNSFLICQQENNNTNMCNTLLTAMFFEYEKIK